MQNGFVQLMQTLAPDLLHEMSLRALVLERIAMMAPVGRRQLAAKLGLTEREIRAASGELREGGFIHPDASGMTLSPPRLIWSFTRPRTATYPSSVMKPRSPVR